MVSQQGVEKEIGQQRKVVAPLQQELVKKSFFSFIPSIFTFSITFRSLALRQNITLVEYIDQHKSVDDAETCYFTFFASLLMHYAPETFKM